MNSHSNLKAQAGAIADALRPVLRSLNERIAILEQALGVAAVTEAKALKFYRGTWRQGEIAKSGQIFTDKGCLWIAQRDTDERPGSAHWRMITKTAAWSGSDE